MHLVLSLCNYYLSCHNVMLIGNNSDVNDSSDDNRLDSDSDDSSSNSGQIQRRPTKQSKDTSERDRMALKKSRRAKAGRAPPGQVTTMLLQVVSSGELFSFSYIF